MQKSLWVGVILAFVAGLTGCASTVDPNMSAVDTKDPFEPFNRDMFVFNQKLDKAVVKPVAELYGKLPEPVLTGVNNVFVNLDEPANTINNVLQGKVEDGLVSVFRFLINTTLGVGGVVDVAGKYANQTVRDEDFEQTLAVWGVPSGPYLVLPFLGPMTVRHGVGYGLGYFSEPQTYFDAGLAEWGAWGLYLVDQRYQMSQPIEMLDTALDPYVMMRQGYIDARLDKIYDGNPPLRPLDFEDDYDTSLEQEATQTQ